MANVIFKTGTSAQYEALLVRDPNTLYWLTDVQKLMKGDVLFGTGAIASAAVPGLMSPEDKEKLDKLSGEGTSGLTAIDASVLIVDAESGGKSVGVRLSGDAGNILSVRQDGLFASVEQVPIGHVTGLTERLEAIEQSIVGGVHYKGAVDTVDDLPSDAAQGDLYEVSADNSEWCWNGEKWFEYGKTTQIDLSGYATKDKVQEIRDSVTAIADSVSWGEI